MSSTSTCEPHCALPHLMQRMHSHRFSRCSSAASLPLPCRCVDALRQLETRQGLSHPCVALMAFEAHMAAGQAQQAGSEAAGGSTS